MTVESLLETMSARELSMWRAYYAVEPFGEYRADLRAGLSTATLVNMQSRGASLKPNDFILEFKKNKVDHTVMRNQFNATLLRQDAKLAAKEGE
jgi:hypothetical protein